MSYRTMARVLRERQDDEHVTTTTIYKADAYRDETGTWCGGVDALHAYTDAATLQELRSNLAEAAQASLDEPDQTCAIEVYVHVDDLATAVVELGQAG